MHTRPCTHATLGKKVHIFIIMKVGGVTHLIQSNPIQAIFISWSTLPLHTVVSLSQILMSKSALSPHTKNSQNERSGAVENSRALFREGSFEKSTGQTNALKMGVDPASPSLGVMDVAAAARAVS